MLLTSTTRSLEIVLAGAVTTNQLAVFPEWSDITDNDATAGDNPTETNDTTAVTIVAAPSADTVRRIVSLLVNNADTVDATVTIQLNDNSTIRPLITVELQPGYCLQYTGTAWQVLSDNGSTIVTIDSGAPSGPAGGDLSGTYPNPVVDRSTFTTFSALGPVTIGATSTQVATKLLVTGTSDSATAAAVGVRNIETIHPFATTSYAAFKAAVSTTASAFTSVDVADFWSSPLTLGAGSAITNRHGLYVDDLSVGTNNYGVNLNVSAGTNKWNLYAPGTASNYFAGPVAIGTTTLNAIRLRVSGNITGAVTAFGITADAVIQSDVTSAANLNRVQISTAAAAFTCTTVSAYIVQQGTIGAGSAITTLQGFNVSSTMTGGTNNRGFVGNLAAATGRWNLYMSGTAQNYIAGPVGFGNTVPTAQAHFAAGSTAASSAPIKFTSGSLMTSAEAGAVEFLTDKAYLTISTGTARKEVALWDAAGTSGRVPFETTNGRLTDSANLAYTSGTGLLVADNLKLTTAGNGLYIKEGSNATMGRATLVAGTVTVSTTKVTANSEIFLTNNVNGGLLGSLSVSARSAGTSFTITSTNVGDTSTISWLIMEPA